MATFSQAKGLRPGPRTEKERFRGFDGGPGTGGRRGGQEEGGPGNHAAVRGPGPPGLGAPPGKDLVV